MQKFTYHTHNNAFGIFDGHNSASEMISKAEELGFEEIGVSNHLILHPHIQNLHGMFFSNTKDLLDVYLRNIEQIREEGAKHKIKVLVGAEIDYFSSATWRNLYEKILPKLDLDYTIGSNHSLLSADETFICNIYHQEFLPSSVTKADMDEFVKNYWLNTVATINSGYFDFIAHLDYCTIFNLGVETKWDEYKWMIIEALSKTKQPFELNTSGYNRIDMQHPNSWMLKELAKRDVPIVISDDAHSVDKIGQHFERAEALLTSLNYTNRFKLEK